MTTRGSHVGTASTALKSELIGLFGIEFSMRQIKKARRVATRLNVAERSWLRKVVETRGVTQAEGNAPVHQAVLTGTGFATVPGPYMHTGEEFGRR